MAVSEIFGELSSDSARIGDPSKGIDDDLMANL